MESLNRLKDVHENEITGERLGMDKPSPGQQSKGQSQAGGLPHIASKSRQTWGPCLPGPEGES